MKINPHTNLKRAVKATTESTARCFAGRQLRPIFLRMQLKEETNRLHTLASMKAKGDGCFDIHGNKIFCPTRHRSHYTITSIKKSYF